MKHTVKPMGFTPVPRKLAQIMVGGLSAPSKMPAPSYGIPAIETCPTGSQLALIPGSTCEICYANGRGNYRFSNVKAAQKRRLDALQGYMELDPGAWVAAMASLLYFEPYFRWLDSGDVFCPEFMGMIRQVARFTPNTLHWLPTHEKWVARRARAAEHPKNLVVRLSAAMCDGEATKATTLTSQVLTRVSWEASPDACPAPRQGNKCGACRKCWDVNVKNVAYLKH